MCLSGYRTFAWYLREKWMHSELNVVTLHQMRSKTVVLQQTSFTVVGHWFHNIDSFVFSIDDADSGRPMRSLSPCHVHRHRRNISDFLCAKSSSPGVDNFRRLCHHYMTGMINGSSTFNCVERYPTLHTYDLTFLTRIVNAIPGPCISLWQGYSAFHTRFVRCTHCLKDFLCYGRIFIRYVLAWNCLTLDREHTNSTFCLSRALIL